MTTLAPPPEVVTPPAHTDHQDDESAGSGVALLRAEVALTAVTATLAITFARLFRSGAFLPKLLLVVVIAHVLAAVARRRRIPLAVTIPLMVVVAGLVLSWLYLASSLRYGLPSGSTWSQARLMLDGAFSPFRRLVPPVPVTVGFEITMAIGLWVLAVFADAAAFSGEAPVQALVPHAAAFLGSSIFARGRYDIAAAAALAAATLLFFAAHRAARASKRHWIQLEQRRGATALFGTGALLAVVAVAVSALIAPHLPGAGSKPVIDLRSIGRGPGPIEVGNPLVGVGNMLGAQSDELFFTVRSPTPHYWRLTSLEEYDGTTQQWKTRRSYHDAESGEPLPAERSGPATTETDRVTLSAMPGIWLPSPYQPKQVDADIDLRYDAGSSSVIAAGRSSLPNVSYDVMAAIPSEAVPDDARRDTRVDPVYLRTPDVSDDVRTVLDQVTGAESTDIGKLRALQSYFRDTFEYSTTVDYSRAPDPTVAFLRAQAGFCQQFSSTFTLMARLLGIPSRVAVGFTYGVADDGKDAEGRTTYSVRGRQAHAWPEVHLSGVGWVAFEPTPGRGNPDATQLTGVTAQQDAGSVGDQPSATTTTTVAGRTPPTTLPTSGRIHLNDQDRSTSPTKATSLGGTGRALLIALIVIGAVAAAAVLARGAVVTAGRRRRRGRATTPGGQVRAAWIDTCDWLGLVSLRPLGSETPAEFSRRARKGVNVDDLALLARLETERLFGDQPLDQAAADAAEAVVHDVRVVVIERTDRRRRLAHLMGWERQRS